MSSFLPTLQKRWKKESMLICSFSVALNSTQSHSVALPMFFFFLPLIFYIKPQLFLNISVPDILMQLYLTYCNVLFHIRSLDPAQSSSWRFSSNPQVEAASHSFMYSFIYVTNFWVPILVLIQLNGKNITQSQRQYPHGVYIPVEETQI